MWDWIQREAIYLWYYLDIQIRQIAPYWALGIVLGSAVSVFGKKYIHGAFARIGRKKMGWLGVIPASLLGIASPLCMYGTIPIAASFSEQGVKDDYLAAFMMSSILLNPQLIFYSGALGQTAVVSVCFQARKRRNYRTICLKHGIIDARKRARYREKPCIRRQRCTSEN